MALVAGALPPSSEKEGEGEGGVRREAGWLQSRRLVKRSPARSLVPSSFLYNPSSLLLAPFNRITERRQVASDSTLLLSLSVCMCVYVCKSREKIRQPESPVRTHTLVQNANLGIPLAFVSASYALSRPLNKIRANDISAVYNWTASRWRDARPDRERILPWIEPRGFENEYCSCLLAAFARRWISVNNLYPGKLRVTVCGTTR